MYRTFTGRLLWCLLVLVFSCCFGAAQTAGPASDDSAPTGEEPPDIEETDARSLPRGFRGIELGMDLESVKQALRQDPLFDYRGDPDVSFLPRTYQALIECSGNVYIERAFFQFDEQKLSIIILVLDRSRMDHYSVLDTLLEKYGAYDTLDPEKVLWSSEETILSLERPLAVKYMDRVVFEEKQERGQAEEDLRELSRQRFLENF
jgi:hypothetical protein